MGDLVILFVPFPDPYSLSLSLPYSFPGEGEVPFLGTVGAVGGCWYAFCDSVRGSSLSWREHPPPPPPPPPPTPHSYGHFGGRK